MPRIASKTNSTQQVEVNAEWTCNELDRALELSVTLLAVAGCWLLLLLLTGQLEANIHVMFRFDIAPSICATGIIITITIIIIIRQQFRSTDSKSKSESE